MQRRCAATWLGLGHRERRPAGGLGRRYIRALARYGTAGLERALPEPLPASLPICDVTDDSPPISPLLLDDVISQEVATPRPATPGENRAPSLLSARLLTPRTRPWEWLRLIAQTAVAAGRLVQSVGTPLVPLAIILPCPLVDSCPLALERGAQITCRSVPRSPFSHLLQHDPPLPRSPSLSGAS